MLKVTITGDRSEGKTLLARLITEKLNDRGIEYTLKLNLYPEEVITISDSNQMRTQLLRETI